MLNFLKNLAGILGGIFFGVTAAYAIKGGPPYPGSLNVVGTYAGVLTPKASPCPVSTVSPAPACTPELVSCAANSIGVFSVGSPESGVGTGAFVMFAQGRVFNGTISAVADPGKATLKGVLSASFNFTVTFPPPDPCPEGSPQPSCTPFTEDITATANGNLKTRIVSTTASTGTTSIRLKGTALLDISHGEVGPDLEPIIACEIPMKVIGFKQSNTAPAAATAP